MNFNQYLVLTLLWACSLAPHAASGQSDTLFMRFDLECTSTFPFQSGSDSYQTLIYGRFERGVLFRIKTMMFRHDTRNMEKKRISKKNATFSRDLAGPTDVEQYMISLLKKYPFGARYPAPGTKRLFIVEDDGGDFFTLYEVKWELNL